MWRQVFRIKFPNLAPDGRPTIAPNAKWLGLRFAGAEGNEELRWDLQPGEAKKVALGLGALGEENVSPPSPRLIP